MERQIASRYAEALFSLAREQDSLDRVGEELAAAVKLMEEIPDLARLLDHPEVEESRKFTLLEKALGAEALVVLMSFIKLLIHRGRISLLDLIEEEYGILVDRAKGIERVKVSAAVEISPQQEARLKAALGRMTGRNVLLEKELAPELLAGMRIELGHRLIDGSALGRLQALRAKLREAGGNR